MAEHGPVELLPVAIQHEGRIPAEVAAYDGKDIPYGDVLQDCLIRLASNDPSLVELSLSRYRLTDVHMRLLWLALKDNTHLIDLNISHNSIKDPGLPWLWNLLRDNHTLRRLNAAQNGWTATSLRQLEDVVARSISLTYFKVEERATMGKVTFLHNCPLVLGVRNSFRSSLERNTPVQLMQCGKCDYVHLVNRSLETFPSTLTSYVHLRELNVSNNRLFDLPRAISKLTNLSSLRVNNNCLVELPKQLCQLPSLTELDCSENLLTNIPFSLASMTTLKQLNLVANLLSPDSVPLRLLNDGDVLVSLARNHPAVKMTGEEDQYGWHHATSRVVIAGNVEIGGLLRGAQFIYGGRKPSKMLQSVLRRLIDESYTFRPFFVSTYPLFGPSTHAPLVGEKGMRVRQESNPGAAPSDKGAPKKKAFRSRLSASSMDEAPSKKPRSTSTLGVPSLADTRRSSSPAVAPGPGDLERMRSNSSFAFAKDAMQGALRNIVSTQPMETPQMEHARQALLECIEVNEHPIAPMLMFKGHNLVVVTLRLDPKSAVGDMLDYAAGWVNTVKSDLLVIKQTHVKHKAVEAESMPVVLVPCYTTEELDKSEVRRRAKLLSKEFATDVFGVIPVCTQSGNGLGKLLRLLGNKGADLHGMDRPSTHEERLLSEKIRLLKEMKHARREDAVLCWKDFQDIAAQCGLRSEKDVESAAAFLASTGAVIHFSRLVCRPVTFLNTEPVRTWIFLDESLLREAMDQVLQNAVIVNWVPLMNRQHLSMFWGDIDEALHPTLLILFEHFGLLSPIMRTLQAAHELDVCYVVPGAVVRPGHKRVSPPEAINHFTSRSYLIGSRSAPPVGRVVHFKNMHPAIFGRVLAELAGSLDPTIGNIDLVTEGCIRITAPSDPEVADIRRADKPGTIPVEKEFSGVDVSKRPPAGAVILVDNSHNRLLIFAWQARGDLIRHVLTLVNRALSEERFAETIDQTLVTCMHCLNKGAEVLDSSVFVLEDLNNLAADGATYAYCTRAARCGVRIDVIAPDVVLQIKDTMKVNYSDLEVFEKVGSGAFGVVYRGKRKKDGDEVAVKMIQLEENEDKTEKFAEFRHEVQLMADLQHPCLVSLLGICNEPLCLITDFCPEGDLCSFLQQRSEAGKPLSVPYIHQAMLDIAQGLAFLHSSTPPVLHLDLKSPNILLMQKPGGKTGDGCDEEGNLCVADPSKPVAKVADFGLSNSSFFPKSERMVDNPLWLAPEVMQNLPYSTPSDVYGFGIIANELFSLRLPFDDFNEKFSFRLENRIVAGERPTIPSRCPAEYKSLIERCWAQDPLERPSIAEVVAELRSLRKQDCGEQPRISDAADAVSPSAGKPPGVDRAASASDGGTGAIDGGAGLGEDFMEETGTQNHEEENEGFADELLRFFEEARNRSTEMPTVSPVYRVHEPRLGRNSLAATVNLAEFSDKEERLTASKTVLEDVKPHEEERPRRSKTSPEGVAPQSLDNEGVPAEIAAKQKTKKTKKTKKTGKKGEKKEKPVGEVREKKRGKKAKKKKAKRDKNPKDSHAGMDASESAEPSSRVSSPDAVTALSGKPPAEAPPLVNPKASQASARVRALEAKALALAETARRLQEEAQELERIALEEMKKEQLELEREQQGLEAAS